METTNWLNFEWQLSAVEECEDIVWEMISLVLIEERMNTACRNIKVFKIAKVMREKHEQLSVHSFMIFRPKKDNLKQDLVTMTFWWQHFLWDTVFSYLQVIPGFPLYCLPELHFCFTVWHVQTTPNLFHWFSPPFPIKSIKKIPKSHLSLNLTDVSNFITFRLS